MASAPAVRGFQEAYAAAFHAFLRDGGESHLRLAYELGREAVEEELSVLDLAALHHDVLLAALRRGSALGDVEDVTSAAGSFFLEALSSFEMVQRGFQEARDAAALERRHAQMLRQLSNFLTDASLALGASDSLEEMLQLVAEQARELVGAECCLVVVHLGPAGARRIEALSCAEGSDARWAAAVRSVDGAERAGLDAPLTTLDGRPLGIVRLFGKSDGAFSEVDEAVLMQLAQMASAAVERSSLYRERA